MLSEVFIQNIDVANCRFIARVDFQGFLVALFGFLEVAHLLVGDAEVRPEKINLGVGVDWRAENTQGPAQTLIAKRADGEIIIVFSLGLLVGNNALYDLLFACIAKKAALNSTVALRRANPPPR